MSLSAYPLQHGRPLYVWRLSTIGPLVKELNELSPQTRERRMYGATCHNPFQRSYLSRRIALYESLRLFTMRACSCVKSEGFPTPIGSTTNIIDLEGTSLGLIWSLRSHFQASAGLASTAYPEFLSRVFVVNAPGFFSTAWSYVKVSWRRADTFISHCSSRDCRATLMKARGGKFSFSARMLVRRFSSSSIHLLCQKPTEASWSGRYSIRPSSTTTSKLYSDATSSRKVRFLVWNVA